MDIKYAIISYHRAGNVLTLDWLKDMGVSKNDIIISLNDPDDLEEYKDLYGDEVSEIICTQKDNVCGNCNNVLDYYRLGQRFLLLDDDVKKMQKYLRHNPNSTHGKLVTIDAEDFKIEMATMFHLLDTYGGEIFGFYPVNTCLHLEGFYDSKNRYGVNKLFQGGVMGFKKGSARFDEKLPMLNDYDIQLQYIANGMPTLRDNLMCVSKAGNGRNKGGLYEFYQAGKDKETLKMLKHKYPALVTVKKGYSGITINRKGLI